VEFVSSGSWAESKVQAFKSFFIIGTEAAWNIWF
jgi:hypothetical protein